MWDVKVPSSFLFFVYLVLEGFFLSSTYLFPPQVFWSWVNQRSLPLNFFIFRQLTVSSLQHVSYSFFLPYKSFRNTRRVWQILLSSPFVLCGSFFHQLFHFAANSTFVPWTNSITMTQSTTHTELSPVSSCLLKSAHSDEWRGAWSQPQKPRPSGGTRRSHERAAVSRRAAHVGLCAFQHEHFLCHSSHPWSLRSLLP